MAFKHFLLILSGALLACPAGLAAQDRQIDLASSIQLVRLSEQGEELSPATSVVPGDLLEFTVVYRNQTDETVTDFVVVAPLSANVVLAGEDAAELDVSVDGGRTWGPLSAARVADEAGTERAAAVEDITHLRWTIASIAPGADGEVRYRAAVK